MIKLNTSIPIDEWAEFRKLTRTVDASSAIRMAIDEWSAAHDGNTEPIVVERGISIKSDRPGRPYLKAGVKTVIVHFRIDAKAWEKFLSASVGLLPNQAPLNAVRWIIATRGGDLEALQRQEEAAQALCNANLARLPHSVLISILGAMASYGAISKDELPTWAL